ncbi:flagellar motor protein MotB [Tenacibaculum todarodis]|uniref:Flagellar motor protein MotB n=1 Tax=Tenacibaculum todarodis TaxID=1850252 RepID=A0A1L3JJ87_9FLAO|nr:OmpA family protein [Tenacibaculum todarodis]APG65174.1 flagellar motor protein MotB [Tenacibaculum todarodis]
MKNIITLSFILISVSLSYGQETYRAADKVFEKMQYLDAAKMYESKLSKGDYSKELLEKAGDAHYFNTDMAKANKWYDILISDYLNEVDAEYIFRYAHTLQGIGENNAAKKWMKIFAKRAKQNDKRIEDHSEGDVVLENVLSIKPQFRLQNLSINTRNSDFGPMYYKNKLVYSSALDSSYYHERIYNWNNQPYLSFYLGRINAVETDVKFIEEFSENINTKYHEATLAFSPDNQKVYFTRNNYIDELGRDDDGVNHLKLYSAELSVDTLSRTKRKEWRNIKELPFNSENYSVGHPTVSKDGKKLYFVSDMPGTIGATDIFVVDILEDDTYSTPKNLGSKVNTSGREMFPYITNNSLYFASDGHIGLGGLDVFESALTSETFQKPTNLGAPLNSQLDDFSFIIKEKENIGFVCSNREGGKGDDDIYSFERFKAITPVKVEDCQQFVKGYVSNSKTGERIPDATVTLYNEKDVKLSQTQSRINGDYAFNFDLGCSKKHYIKVEKNGYNPNQKIFVTSSISSETIVPLDIETIDELIVEDNGLLKIKIGIIYFDLDKFFIRDDSASELNKIVVLMTKYPKMVINIESHTDSRSKDDYNLELSNNRAQATKNYIISKGISANRINNATGFGETQLINKCSNGVSCTEAQHQLNRRSEFIILKI